MGRWVVGASGRLSGVGDRITIPTSDSQGSSGPRRASLGRVLGLLGAAALVGVFVAALGGQDTPTSDVAAVEDGVAAPPIVERVERPLDSAVFPGTGSVTAVVEVDGALLAAVSGDFWGTSIWLLDEASDTWNLTDGLAGVWVLDVASHPEGVVVVGFDRFDRSPALFVGRPGSLEARAIDMRPGQIPSRVESTSEGVFVFSRFGDAFTSSLPGSVYRLDAEFGLEWLQSDTGDALVDDVFELDGSVIAVGSGAGAPRMWRVGSEARLEPIDVGIDVTRGRIAAAGVLGTGDVVGLVVESLEGSLPATAVYRLEPPYDQIDEPIAGTWDRLVPIGGDLLALPADGVVMLRTVGEASWDATRAVYLDDTDPLADPVERPVLIGDAVRRASGDLVFAGTTSGRTTVPIVASEGTVGLRFELASRRWSLIDEAGDGGAVHIGRTQVAIRDGSVVVRDGFDERWVQPVFADEDSVGGQVEVVELDFGFLLTASRPYQSLWFSLDGDAWQLIARDPFRVAGSGDEALALVGGVDEIVALRIDRNGPVEVGRAIDPLPITGDRFARVTGLGYVSGPVDGAVYASSDGLDWAALDLGVDVDSLLVIANTLAVRTAEGWFTFESEGDLAPIRLPDGSLATRFDLVSVRDALLWINGADSWITADSESWIDVSLGIWEGADGLMFDAWVGGGDVIALIGGPDDRAFYKALYR